MSFACLAQSVIIGQGFFMMGAGNGEPDERPVHRVTLHAYAIDAHEVTAAQYDSCVKAGRCTPAHYTDGKCLMWTSRGLDKVKVPERYRSPDYPVVCVTWHQAQAYCRFKDKRLPTEAEWEYAASSRGAAGPYAWGKQAPDSTRCTPESLRRPAPGGRYPHNGAGLYDMTGNVWEWTGDRYQTDYYRYSPGENPGGPDVGRYRVIRGGGWYSGPSALRITNRQWFPPEYGEVSVGFRCVR